MQHLSRGHRRDIPPPLFLYRAERKRPSGHRKIPLFVLPVMPDVLDIIIVLQHINELLHILQVARKGFSGFHHDRKLLFHTWAKVEYSSWILCFFPQNTNVCRNCFACDKYNRFPMILQAFPIAPSPLTYYDNIAKYTHRKNVNSTIQGLYQYSRWYGSFFIYLLLKERRFSPCRFSISLSLFGFPSTVSQALLMMRSRSSCGLLCLSQWLPAFSFCLIAEMMTERIET